MSVHLTEQLQIVNASFTAHVVVAFLASFSALELWQLIVDQTQVEFINLIILPRRFQSLQTMQLIHHEQLQFYV